jgi:potassium channel subfamily K, other eukaryote
VTIPFAILLEIPGLSGHWYVRTDENKVVDVQPNPPLIVVGMGISIAAAIIANIALIRRFLEMQPKLMTFVAVITLAVHGEELAI